MVRKIRNQFFALLAKTKLTSALILSLSQSIAAADMDHAQLEAFLTAQARRQGSGGGGVSAEQTAALSRFWRSQQARVRESLVAQSRWEPSLRGLSWRVDLQTGASRGSPTHSGPVALVEMELGRTGQVRPTSCFLDFMSLSSLSLLEAFHFIACDSGFASVPFLWLTHI